MEVKQNEEEEFISLLIKWYLRHESEKDVAQRVQVHGEANVSRS